MFINFFFHQIFHILVYFLYKNCTSSHATPLPLPPKKKSPLSLQATSLKKLRSSQAAPLFENLVGGSNSPPQQKGKGGECTLYFFVHNCSGSQTANFGEKTPKIIDKFSPGAFYSHPHTSLTIRHKRVADFGH